MTRPLSLCCSCHSCDPLRSHSWRGLWRRGQRPSTNCRLRSLRYSHSPSMVAASSEVFLRPSSLLSTLTCTHTHTPNSPAYNHFDLFFQVETDQSQFRSTLETIRALQPRVAEVSKLRRDLEELDQRISVEASKLVGSDSSRSQITVNRELQDAQMRV